MTTSGSVDYNLTRNQIIQEALELVGVYSVGETPSAEDYETASRSLNMMVKTWQVDGVRVWKVSEATLTLVASQASYTLGPGGDVVIDKPLRIVEARRRDPSNNDTPMFSMSRDEYELLSDKTTASTPTQYYYQPGLSTGTLYVWPTASSTVAASDTLRFSYYSLLEDFDASGDNPDFPSEWLGTLAYGLAVWVAPKFKVPLADIADVVSMASALKDKLDGWDQEDESVYIGPDFRWS